MAELEPTRSSAAPRKAPPTEPDGSAAEMTKTMAAVVPTLAAATPQTAAYMHAMTHKKVTGNSRARCPLLKAPSM